MDIQFKGPMEQFGEFDEEQQEQIRTGIEEGIDVAPYANRAFMPLQMEAIRIGLEKGLDVSVYANPSFDWFQMEEIRLGLEYNLPVSRYAKPEIEYQKMHQIRLALAEGYDLGRRTNLDWKTLEQLRLAHGYGIPLDPYIEQGYDAEQLEQIRICKESGINIEPYLSLELRGISLQEIRLGLEHFIDVSIYAKPAYTWQQMREIRLGLEEQLDIRLYSNPLYNWKQMQELRLGLADGLNITAYNNLMYTENDMHRMRRTLLVTQDIIGSNSKHKISNEQFQLQISEDGMEAIFTLNSSIRGRSRTKLRSLLETNGIKAGIQESVLQQVISEHQLHEPYVIAQGKPAKNGADGYYELFFDTTVEANTYTADGSLDFEQREFYRLVKKGDKLALYHPAEEGKDGFDVFGNVLPAKKGKEQKRLHGKGMILLPDGVTYQALLEGCVKYIPTSSSLDVYRMMVLWHVTAAQEPVDFNGSIYVAGDIGDNVILAATEDIIVEGNCEAAHLIAGNQIILKNGINGKHKAMLEVGGNIEAAFLESVTIRGTGNLKTNYALDCDIEITGNAEFFGSKGMIVGGRMEAPKGIKCVSLGNQSGIATEIKIGLSEEMWEQNKRLLLATDRVQKELKLLNRGLDKFKNRFSQEVYQGDEMYKKIEDAIYTKKLEMEKINDAKVRLSSKTEELREAKVTVTDTIYEGVTFKIENATWNASELHNVSIYKHGDMILSSRNED